MAHRTDSGWAWMVAIGVFVNLFCIMGSIQSAGIIFVELMEYFDVSASISSLMFAIYFIFNSITAMIVPVLSARTDLRTVAILGGSAFVTGWSLLGVAPNIYFVAIIFGVFTGAGFQMLCITSFSMLAQYFDKRHALVSGIVTASSGLAVMVLPQLFALLLEKFNVLGTALIFGGICTHVIAAAALFRPVKIDTTRTDNEVTNTTSEKVLNSSHSEINTSQTDASHGSRESNAEIKEQHSKTTLKNCILVKLSFNLFSNSTYAMVVVASVVSMNSLFALMNFGPARAREIGLTNTDISLLLTIYGALDVIGRLMAGFLASYAKLHPAMIMCWSIVVTGIMTIVCAFFSTYAAICVILTIVLPLGNCVFVLFPVVLKKILPPEDFTRGMALLNVCMGVYGFLAPMMLAAIKDATGDFKISLLIVGILFLIGGTIYLCAFLMMMKKSRKEEKTKPPVFH